ncbi:MAG TPA: IS4 family transposase [Candidatus Saccharimonadales bacterium]|nr:IS4 family transposase [Candidatus Saccharimonadales bacterium]
MRQQTNVPAATFKSLFKENFTHQFITALLRRCGVRRRRPPGLSAFELIGALVFHVVGGAGRFSEHVKQFAKKKITDGALSQRREVLPITVLEGMMEAALKPKADPSQHPEAFYQGLRLCGIDGSTFSVTNTPQVKKSMKKARSRRGRAAFPKVGVAVMVELGLHNPLAAALGAEGESEMVLSKRAVASQPEKSLLISDRYYGVPVLLVDWSAEAERHFLVRVKSNLKRRLLGVLPDGSALVEIESGGKTRQVREILARVQRGSGGGFTTVRLWTSLLDWQRYPAKELLALYGRRWEQEIFYKEMKVDMRSMPYLQSHTPLTAMQEIAALILAYAVLVDYRIEAAKVGEVGVLRISFLKTFELVRGLWQFLEVSADLLGPEGIRLLVRRTLRKIADAAIPKRRQRSCPRALRQPVSSWPRLRKNTYQTGPIEYSVGEIYA